MSLFDPAAHTCRHDKATLGRTINADGTSRIWQRCDTCGENTGGPGVWIPHQQAGQPLEALPVFDGPYRVERPPCVRCGRFGTQLHHFMPRHTAESHGVPGEQDLWPTAHLCTDCHDRWHLWVERDR